MIPPLGATKEYETAVIWWGDVGVDEIRTVHVQMFSGSMSEATRYRPR